MTAREVLLKAADHIERYGWVQGMFTDKNGAYCIRGAAILVAPLQAQADNRLDAYELLASHLGLCRERAVVAEHVSAWNDTPGRTAAEVIAALRGAAEAAP